MKVYIYVHTFRHSVAVGVVNKLLQLLYYLRYIYICYSSCKNYSYCITYAIYTCMSARIYTYTYMYKHIKLACMRTAALCVCVCVCVCMRARARILYICDIRDS